MRFRRWFILGILLTAGILLLANIGFTDTEAAKSEKGIVWVKYDEGIKLAAKEQKAILVDFYTNWCGYCKKMDRETFSDPKVAGYLGEKFIAVKVNAESNETVVTPGGPVSEKELSRLFGVRGYPTYWFLSSDGEKINNLSGYRPPDIFLTVAQYIGDSHYKTKTWKEYQESLPAN